MSGVSSIVDKPVAAALTVNEIFFSIQGEGTRAGRPSVFVRLTGCPLRCTWCDTAYAFYEGTRRSVADVVAEAAAYPCRLLCLTGGEPLAQPPAFGLVTALADAGFEVVVETSGHVLLEPLDPRAVAIMDVKAPGSGEVHRTEWRNLDLLRPKDEIKLVLKDRADYEWARAIVSGKRLAERCPVLFSPVHGVLDPALLARWILDDGVPVRLQVQLHKVLWPQAERGV
jgi:7-carboxy-7-deazaguanine synthase